MHGIPLNQFIPPGRPESDDVLRKLVRAKYNIFDLETTEQLENQSSPRIFLNNIVGVIENGQIMGAWGTQRDITEKRAIEDVLQKQRKMLLESQRIAKLGSWEWNIEANTLEWSDEVYRLFRISKQEFGATYESFLMSIHPDDREKINDRVSACLERGTDYINQSHGVNDGSESRIF